MNEMLNLNRPFYIRQTLAAYSIVPRKARLLALAHRLSDLLQCHCVKCQFLQKMFSILTYHTYGTMYVKLNYWSLELDAAAVACCVSTSRVQAFDGHDQSIIISLALRPI